MQFTFYAKEISYKMGQRLLNYRNAQYLTYHNKVLGVTLSYTILHLELGTCSFICQGTSTRKQKGTFSVFESSCRLLPV